VRTLINKRIIIGSALAAAVATTAMILAHKEIGMAKMESTMTIARPVEEVFRFFLDLDRNGRKTDSVPKGRLASTKQTWIQR
jgi:uncharacterized membrane protein